VETETVETLAAELMEDLGLPGRGIQLRRLAGGWRLETKPEHADAIVALKHNRTMKPLSEQAPETRLQRSSAIHAWDGTNFQYSPAA
jgi:segregation and condensation protein B